MKREDIETVKKMSDGLRVLTKSRESVAAGYINEMLIKSKIEPVRVYTKSDHSSAIISKPIAEAIKVLVLSEYDARIAEVTKKITDLGVTI